jgi:hypothetical protein
MVFDLVWFFFGVPGVRGALLIGFYSLVGRSFLIRDRESVLGLLVVFGLCLCSLGGSEVARFMLAAC